MLSFWKSSNHPILLNLGSSIGAGVDGEVFHLLNNDNKVIKLSSFIEHNDIAVESAWDRIEEVLKHIVEIQPSICTRIYEYQKVNKQFLWMDYTDEQSKLDYILYYYIMDKCFPISDDEYKVFFSLVSHEDVNLNKDYDLETIKKMTEGMARGLDFDVGRVIFFCENLKKSPVRQADIHPRNIMKNSDGNFKFVDFDRCYLKKEN